MNTTHIPKQATTYEVCGKRDVKRQRKRWGVITVAKTGYCLTPEVKDKEFLPHRKHNAYPLQRPND
jgi:DNA-binding winged helix-turn-helix (wHTH) protein